MQLRANMFTFVRILHVISLWIMGLAALAMVVATVLSAIGVFPWLQFEAGFGEASPIAGMIAQIGLTALLVLIAGFFPSSLRVMQLENSHRQFKLSMKDVAEAYHAAHVADRKGAFTLSSEFDQVRERIDYLRQHPDLKLLEADIITLAAQMSQQSHRLAEIYSDTRVARGQGLPGPAPARGRGAAEAHRGGSQDLPRDHALEQPGRARRGRGGEPAPTARRAAPGGAPRAGLQLRRPQGRRDEAPAEAAPRPRGPAVTHGHGPARPDNVRPLGEQQRHAAE
jgi:hypothetical protein